MTHTSETRAQSDIASCVMSENPAQADTVQLEWRACYQGEQLWLNGRMIGVWQLGYASFMGELISNELDAGTEHAALEAAARQWLAPLCVSSAPAPVDVDPVEPTHWCGEHKPREREE